MSDTILEVEDLSVEFATYGGNVKAVRGISFDVHRGETLAIVGESGCGKSVSVQSIMGLIPVPPGKITSGTALHVQSRVPLNPLANLAFFPSIGAFIQLERARKIAFLDQPADRAGVHVDVCGHGPR